MRKMGKGTDFEIITDHSNWKVNLVKYFDKKPVHLPSNIIASAKIASHSMWQKTKNRIYKLKALK